MHMYGPSLFRTVSLLSLACEAKRRCSGCRSCIESSLVARGGGVSEWANVMSTLMRSVSASREPGAEGRGLQRRLGFL